MVVQISLMDPLNRRRTSLMEDSTILTIEFLRGRLLFERSISRRARQRAEDLEKKVIELEEQVKMVTLQRKIAEKATADVLAILENHGLSDLSNEFESESGRDTPCEYGVNNDSGNNGERFLSSKGRQNGPEALSSSDTDSSPLYGSFPWKGHHDSSHSRKKYNNPKHRRETSWSSISSSSKNHHHGMSFHKIRHKKTRSASIPGYISGEVDCQENEVVPYFEGFQNCSDGYERDKDMEKALEHRSLPIDEYEAMAKAQIDLEEKFRENNYAISGSYNWRNHSDMYEKKDESKAQLNSNAQEDDTEAIDICLFERSLRVPKSFDGTRGYNHQRSETFSSDDFLGRENLHSQLKEKQSESPENYHSHSSNQHNQEPYSHYYPDFKLIDKAESSRVLFFEELIAAGVKDIMPRSFDGKGSYDNLKSKTFSSELFGQENSTSQLKGSQNESSVNCHYQSSNRHSQEPYSHYYPDSKLIDKAESSRVLFLEELLGAGVKDIMPKSFDGKGSYDNRKSKPFSSDLFGQENSTSQLKRSQNETLVNCHYQSSDLHLQEPYGLHYPDSKQIDKAEPTDFSFFKGILRAEAKEKMQTSVDGTKGYSNQRSRIFSVSDFFAHENSHSQLKENQNESTEDYHDSSNMHNQEPYGYHYPDYKQIDHFPTDVHGGLHQNETSRNKKDDLNALVCHEQPHQFSGVLESLKQAKTFLQELNNSLRLVDTEYFTKACKPSAYVSKSEKKLDFPARSSSLSRQPTHFPDEALTGSNVQDSTSRLHSNFFLDRRISRTNGYFSKTWSLTGVDQSLADPQLLNGSRFNSRKDPYDAFCDGGILSSTKQVYPCFPIFPIY
ncbi:uncharacterized protein LOC107466782 isoform X1 [Arachis duranensis]|uniref:Uncharacterized protein LOC107466782 isoform X1 n=2 Tax=Arachis duranensis TaxID=130453 RepID=A0A6P4C6L7_ARADU|nr:uncharacterized protein LOC107466782 isoform X1 [Arachis duranensis]